MTADLRVTVTFPRAATTARVLNASTPAHRVALEAAQGAVSGWCRIAAEDKHVATSGLQVFCRASGTDTVGAIALTIRRAVMACWDDGRDAHPDSVGRFALADACPEGCIDVCRAAALVACALAGMVDPTDDHAAIIAEWWQGVVARRQGDVGANLAPLRWPAGGEFRRALDALVATAPGGAA